MKVYIAISQVAARLAKEGISKSRKNQQQGYSFRGIDDVYNALAPFLTEAKLCILPTVLERECVERRSAKDTALFYVTVKVRFDFVSAEDQSKHEVVTYGEAMDSADKATNKALSAAYKYAAMQAFCIPTEGDNDADATTHEVKASAKITPTAGAKDNISPEQRVKVDKIVSAVTDWLNSGSVTDAVMTKENADFDADETVYFWTKFDSKQRSAMKKEHDRLKAKASGLTTADQA
jgi:hypothetical protein